MMSGNIILMSFLSLLQSDSNIGTY